MDPRRERRRALAEQLLLVACAGCQVEVITQALESARIEDYDVDVKARFETADLGPELEEYPDHLSWWYTTIVMDVAVETTEANEAKVRRLLDPAEDACIVSRSVERCADFDISKELSVRSVDGRANALCTGYRLPTPGPSAVSSRHRRNASRERTVRYPIVWTGSFRGGVSRRLSTAQPASPADRR